MPLTLFLLALVVFAMGTSEFMLAGLLPGIAADLHVSLGTAGLLTSAFAVGMVVGAPLLAAVSRRWPRRITLIGCVLLFLTMHVIGALATDFTVLLLTRTAAAFANAGFLAVAVTAAVELVPPDRKARALAVLLGGTTLATVVGVPGGAVLGGLLGWRTTFWTLALLCVPALAGLLRVSFGRPDGPPDDLTTELAELRRPLLLLVLLLAALVNAGTFGAFTFLAPVITEGAGLPEVPWVPVALMAFGVGSFLGVTAAGRVADRRPGLVVAVGGPALVVGWLALAAAAGRPGPVLVLVPALGLLAFGVGSTLIARVLYAAAGAPTMASSYATAALNLGAVAGPVLAAGSISTGLAERGPAVTAAALVLAALLAAAVFRRLILPARGRS